MESTVFFAKQDNKSVIQGLYNEISILLKQARESDRADFCLEFVGAALHGMGSYPEEYDDRCRFNIMYIGETLIRLMKTFRRESSYEIQQLFSCCYRFVIEFQASGVSQISPDLLALVHKVHENENLYDLDTKMTIRYAEHQMLMEVLKRYIYHPNMPALQSLDETFKNVAQQRAEASAELDERQKRVDVLKESLDKYETAFNFVGLYDGFKHLRSTKINEGRVSFGSLLILGGLMIAPFLFKFYTSVYPVNGFVPDTGFYVGLAGFELLLAYFFRVALHNFRSVKTQLLQIDLRMTLCQFVQSYAKYAKDVKQGNPELLDRFEQIVFSGIVNGEGAILSTFDGLEQIGNIIEKFKAR